MSEPMLNRTPSNKIDFPTTKYRDDPSIVTDLPPLLSSKANFKYRTIQIGLTYKSKHLGLVSNLKATIALSSSLLIGSFRSIPAANGCQADRRSNERGAEQERAGPRADRQRNSRFRQRPGKPGAGCKRSGGRRERE